ncbi:hypothetical protein KKQ10_00970 [Pseudomonas sp. MG-9]|uniref:hypothetical protein n=1 Tax=Pseudomonas sp. MG-9 TaxID=2839032 RepID=UPI001C00493F|nr:hypothetical protein [Pseudomonas sp. MG-9]MBT9263436.1 hypothetical protein [Pseudomonas sp. MG-9]
MAADEMKAAKEEGVYRQTQWRALMLIQRAACRLSRLSDLTVASVWNRVVEYPFRQTIRSMAFYHRGVALHEIDNSVRHIFF